MSVIAEPERSGGEEFHCLHIVSIEKCLFAQNEILRCFAPQNDRLLESVWRSTSDYCCMTSGQAQ